MGKHRRPKIQITRNFRKRVQKIRQGEKYVRNNTKINFPELKKFPD